MEGLAPVILDGILQYVFAEISEKDGNDYAPSSRSKVRLTDIYLSEITSILY